MQYLCVPQLLIKLPRPDPSEEEEYQPSPPSRPGSSCRGTPKKIMRNTFMELFTVTAVC